jgi:uncharacterized protein YjbI with pentapeptide repeats
MQQANDDNMLGSDTKDQVLRKNEGVPQLPESVIPQMNEKQSVATEKPNVDWTKLLGEIVVPLAVGVITALVTWQTFNLNFNYTQKADRDRDQIQKNADETRQYEIMSKYLDRMTNLMIRENLASPNSREDVRSVARAITLNAVRQLEGEPKGQLLKFLYEAKLVGGECIFSSEENRFKKCKDTVVDIKGIKLDKAVVDPSLNLLGIDLEKAYLPNAKLPEIFLANAEMTGADLTDADLTKASLNDTKLSAAKLIKATLSGATLARANLSGANLTEANLAGANLQEANLSAANLQKANLSAANLQRADLTCARQVIRKGKPECTDLRGADLRGANLTDANLKDADLKGAFYDKDYGSHKGTKIDPSYKRVMRLCPSDIPQGSDLHELDEKCNAAPF